MSTSPRLYVHQRPLQADQVAPTIGVDGRCALGTRKSYGIIRGGDQDALRETIGGQFYDLADSPSWRNLNGDIKSAIGKS